MRGTSSARRGDADHTMAGRMADIMARLMGDIMVGRTGDITETLDERGVITDDQLRS